MQQIFVGPTGAQLRDERTAAGVKAFELAIRMHVNSTRVSQIEALAKVTADTAERYRAALAECIAEEAAS